MTDEPPNDSGNIVNMRMRRMLRGLSQMIDKEEERERALMDLLWPQATLIRHRGSLAAFRSAGPQVEDWLHRKRNPERYDENAQRLMFETLAFYNRFYWQWRFPDVTMDRITELSDIVDDQGIDQDDWFDWSVKQIGAADIKELCSDLRHALSLHGFHEDEWESAQWIIGEIVWRAKHIPWHLGEAK